MFGEHENADAFEDENNILDWARIDKDDIKLEKINNFDDKLKKKLKIEDGELLVRIKEENKEINSCTYGSEVTNENHNKKAEKQQQLLSSSQKTLK